MKYRAIIIDLDGTAVDSPSKNISSSRLAAAVKRLEELDVKICAATGRSKASAQEVVESLGLSQPMIVAGGAQIISSDYQKVIQQISVEKESLKTMVKVLSSLDKTFLWNDCTLEDYIENGGWQLDDFDVNSETYFFEVCYVPDDEANELADKINKINGITASIAIAHRPSMKDIHVTSDNATKEHAIEVLSQLINVPTEHMIGVGDGANDIHLFKAVGHKVAMGNAANELKEKADEVVGDIKDDGLAEYFERLIKEIKESNLDKIEIVQPEANDALGLAKMHAQSWRDSYVGINGLTAESVEDKMRNKTSEKGLSIYRETFEKARKNPEQCYYRIAKTGNEVVGFIHGVNEEKQEVGAVYIAEQYKGSGLAQKLMDGLMSWFDLGRDIEFAVVRDNSRAVNFYESYGFEIVETDPKDYERYLPLIVVKMKRRGDKK